MISIPKKFLRNASGVRKMGRPVETGKNVLEYMCARLGLEDYSAQSILDIGCGVRFTQTFLEYDLPVKEYVGIEVDKETIAFLKNNVKDERFSYFYADQKNAYYHPNGGHDFEVMSDRLPRPFDIISMFSVITHQNPDEAKLSFDLARQCAGKTGRLFFTALVHGEGHAPFENMAGRQGVLEPYSEAHKQTLREKAEAGAAYLEWDSDRPGKMSGYSLEALRALVAESGWTVQSVEPPFPNDVPVQTSFYCTLSE